MPRDDCRRVEDAISSEDPLNAELAEHVRTCERCRAFSEIAALCAPPVQVGQTESLARGVGEAVRRVAQQRGGRWDRCRERTPLLIALVGYSIAALSMTITALSGQAGGLAPRMAADMPFPPSPPPPEPAMTAAILAASALWIATAVLLTRRRRAVA